MESYSRYRENKIVSELLKALPELEASYREHIADNGDPLPFVYLPDAVRDVRQQMDSGMLPNDFFERFAQAIEDALNSDPAAHDLIGIGILEELRSSKLWDVMRDRLGKRSLQVVHEGASVLQSGAARPEPTDSCGG